MEEPFPNKLDFSTSENSLKLEFNQEKEKTRLNLRKSKLDKILLSKRKIILSNNTDNNFIETKKKYELNLDEIKPNIPPKYQLDIPLFLDSVRKYYY